MCGNQVAPYGAFDNEGEEARLQVLSFEITETLKRSCRSCHAQQNDCDKFCRHCGINYDLADSTTKEITADVTERGLNDARRSNYETRPLSNPYCDFSLYTSPVIRLMTMDLDQLAGSLRDSPWAMRLIATLIAIPIWMMIILLSPLNAYLAVRAMGRQA